MYKYKKKKNKQWSVLLCSDPKSQEGENNMVIMVMGVHQAER